MSGIRPANNCEETLYHDGYYTFLRAEGDDRDYIQTINETEYARRLAATKELIGQGQEAGWSAGRLALTTELMFGHEPETVASFDEATHQSPSGLSRSEQYAYMATITEGMVDVGAIPNYESVIARERMGHLPGQENPLLPQTAAYQEPLAA